MPKGRGRRQGKVFHGVFVVHREHQKGAAGCVGEEVGDVAFAWALGLGKGQVGAGRDMGQCGEIWPMRGEDLRGEYRVRYSMEPWMVTGLTILLGLR